MKKVTACMTFVVGLAAVGAMFNAAAGDTAAVPRVTNDDFARSDRFLLGKANTDLLNGDIAFRWIDRGAAFYYRNQSAGGTRYLLGESATGKASPLFDHQAMATALSAALNTRISAQSLPIKQLTRLDKDNYEVVSGEKTLRCDMAAKICGAPRIAKEDPTAIASPDGRYAVFSRDYNLWLKNNGSGEERALTRDGVRGWSYGRPPESSTMEISNRRADLQPPVAALWSPDGRRFVSYQLDERQVPEIALVQAIPEDGSFRPKLHTYHYDLVGDKPPRASYFIFDVENNTRVAVDYPAIPATFRVPLALGYLSWSADAGRLYLLDSPISEPFMKLVEVNPRTGAVRLLVEEHSDTTYFPNSNYIGPPNVRVLTGGDVIWFSERSGWGHLYRYDGKSGKLKNAITRGEWLVRDILRVDERAEYIYFAGNGREPGEDIYNRHLYRVKFDGSDLKLLTPERGDHELAAPIDPVLAAANGFPRLPAPLPCLSPNGAYVIDHFSTVDAPGRWLLRRSDGAIIARLADEDARSLPPYTAPESFAVKSADGRYDLYGVLSKPANFDPRKRYPVIDHDYPGPQSIKAPKNFAGGGAGSAIFSDAQALADLGFIVIQVDGRGGPFRSKAFRDLSYRNMDKVGTLEDHVAALRQLAKTRPWLDLERVGMFGNSGGGFATAHALIDYPDFFKVGVSSAGNHEQRSYLRMWGETYHGPPGSTDYDKVFAGKDASRFKGKLLLAYGEMDDNVHPANTLRLVDALIKANKQFDMLVMPNVNHAISANPYFKRIIQNYFLKNLMGMQLPSDSDMVLPRAAQR